MSSNASNVIATNYRVGKKIGEGTFGVVFEGLDLRNNQRVAIKFEPLAGSTRKVEEEAKVLKALDGMSGIPRFHLCTKEGLHRILITSLLGPTLEQLFDKCERRFTLQTVCLIAIQLITRFKDIHGRGYIYEYTAPENFLLGLPGTISQTIIHMFDLGMTKQYKGSITGKHVPDKKKMAACGSPRFLSIRAHQSKQRSRKDDLESLGYLMIYFARGGLPWSGKSIATMHELKEKTTVETLCANLPNVFDTYMNYVKRLNFEALPDYQSLTNLFLNMHEIGATDTVRGIGTFDWDKTGPEATPISPASIHPILPISIPQTSIQNDGISNRHEESIAEREVVDQLALEKAMRIDIEKEMLQKHRKEIDELNMKYNTIVIRQEDIYDANLAKEQDKAATMEKQYQAKMEEEEVNFVLASQRREQKLTARLENIVLEEKEKNAKLQMEIEALREQLQSLQAQKLDSKPLAAHLQHSIDDSPSDMLDEEELEHHHILVI